MQCNPKLLKKSLTSKRRTTKKNEEEVEVSNALAEIHKQTGVCESDKHQAPKLGKPKVYHPVDFPT